MLSSYINFTIGQYIIEPKKTLKKWTKPNVNMEVLSNLEYAYVRNKIDKNICFLKTNFNNNGIFRIKGSHLRYVLLRPSWTYKNCKLAN